MNLINTSKDIRRGLIDPLIRYQEVEPAGAEKGKKAKTKPTAIR